MKYNIYVVECTSCIVRVSRTNVSSSPIGYINMCTIYVYCTYIVQCTIYTVYYCTYTIRTPTYTVCTLYDVHCTDTVLMSKVKSSYSLITLYADIIGIN